MTTATSEIELFTVGGHDGYLRGVNDAFARLLGLTPAEVSGRSLLELVHPQDLAAVTGALSKLQAGTPEVLVDSRFVQRDGRCVHLQWVARPIPGGDFWWAAGRDTTAFHRLLAERADLQAQFELAVGPTSAAMWELDVRSGRLLWETRAATVLHVEPDAVPASIAELAALAHPDDAPALGVAVDRAATLDSFEVAFRLEPPTDDRGADPRHLSLRGRVVDRDRGGRPARIVGVLLDVTGEKAMEEQLLRMVTLDALTGVPNRRAYEHALRAEWRRAARSGLPVSVAMIDVDRFKIFNDAHGHLVGDEALCAIARALAGCVHREGDVVARFGGEEFAVLLPGTDEAGAAAVALAMVEAVREVAVRQAGGQPLTVSIGVCTWTPTQEPELTAVAALDRADRAVLAARTDGRDRAVTYGATLAERDAVEAAIVGGLAAGEFLLHYQPVVDLATGRPVAVEALIRWERPGIGLVPPSEFVPAAEASSLICRLDAWVLGEACGQLAAWIATGAVPSGFYIAVNVSARHTAEPSFVDAVTTALSSAGLPPQRLELEVTETALAAAVPMDDALARLRELGVRVAIDDFGTGYTSVGQLPHLPADTLKIDRSFAASTDPRRRELVRLMVGAAHAYDLGVVAEGVEDDEVRAFLQGAGCDLAQGWFFGRPMPAAAAGAWLTEHA